MIDRLKKLVSLGDHVCPWWLAYSWDNPLRRFIHNADKIIKPYVQPGGKALDVGCGMGYFSIAMANYAGPGGKALAVDIQQKMLDILKKRAEKTAVGKSISTILVKDENFSIPEPVDFILAFWTLHEVKNKEALMRNLYSNHKKGGRYLLVEPLIHTSQSLFYEEVKICRKVGYRVAELPEITFSRAALFEKLE